MNKDRSIKENAEYIDFINTNKPLLEISWFNMGIYSCYLVIKEFSFMIFRIEKENILVKKVNKENKKLKIMFNSEDKSIKIMDKEEEPYYYSEEAQVNYKVIEYFIFDSKEKFNSVYEYFNKLKNDKKEEIDIQERKRQNEILEIAKKILGDSKTDLFVNNFIEYYYRDEFLSIDFINTQKIRMGLYVENEISNTDDKLFMFIKYIKDKFQFENKDELVQVVIEIINIKSISKYSRIFINQFEYFKNVGNCNLDDLVEKYINNDMIEKSLLTEKELLGKFICYLIDNRKIDETNYSVAYNYIYRLIEEKREKNKIRDFEKLILDFNRIEKVVSIDKVDLMNGIEFEEFILELFVKLGYKCDRTKVTGDQGIDIIAQKNNEKIGIQAKCYSNTVSNSAIQEVVAGINYYHLEKAMVITNNYFTKSAKELANANKVILWDRDMLKTKIEQIL